METYESFASITETYLGELQEVVIQTFTEECDNKVIYIFFIYCYELSFIKLIYNDFKPKELLTVELTNDQVHSLGVALSRLETLIGYKCIIDVVEEGDDNRKDIYSCFIELIRRGLLNSPEEQQVIINF